MQQTELINLALDVGLATDTFPMARVQTIFARADQTDDKRGGDHALQLHSFLEAIVHLSFARANPRFGEVGSERTVQNSLPGCFERLLTRSLLKKAKRVRATRALNDSTRASNDRRAGWEPRRVA